MLLYIVIWMLTLADLTHAEAITSEQAELHVKETENITLSCSYSSAYSLLWYRQHHTSAPQFLMLILQSSGKVIQTSDERLSGKLNVDKNRVDLEIPFSAVKDSAVYFCALQTTGEELQAAVKISSAIITDVPFQHDAAQRNYPALCCWEWKV
ncbi:hypothetical protein G5714_001992 [Onychostoma macrolepis]|uniref:Immunoglobulin V-set domain-containing protein n=1 Tax=Onychostoma macrolepis TaxID=369639 RepID=A0A7J6DDX9_9TELE|nr:hypothetical protein G5714_001992 [Onychostoma macrolepis]